MANLADLTVAIGTKLEKFEAGMRSIPRRAGEAANGVVERFEKMAPKLEAAAKAGAVAAGAGIVYGATEGLKRGALEDKLAGQLRLDEGEAKAAGNIAGDVYTAGVGESLEQVNDAVAGIVGGELAKLGDSDAVDRLSRKALGVAATFDGDVNDAISRAGALMRGGLARDADHAFDLIVAGSQEISPTLRDELGDATREYAKHFGDLGISGEQAYGLLASADDQFSLDKTGDAIKELSIRATDMSTSTTAAFDLMGLDSQNMADRILAGGDTARGAFDDIVDGLLSMESPSERANAAVALFGTPVEDLGTAKIPAFLKSLDDMGDGLVDVEGRSDELGDTLAGNGQRSVDQFARKIEGMLASVTDAPGILGDAAVAVGGMGQALKPIGPAVAAAGVVFKDQLSDMASAAGRSMGRAAKASAKGATRAIKSLARWTAAGAKWVTSTLAQGAKALASMARTAAGFAAKYALMAAKSLVAAGKMAASWIIAMGPVAWVIAGIVGLVAVVVKNWGTIKEWTGKIWGWIWDKIGGTVTGIVDTVVDFAGRILELHRKAFDAVLGVVKGAGRMIVDAIKRAVDLWITIYVDIPRRILGALGNLAGLLVRKGSDTIAGLSRGVTDRSRTFMIWIAGIPARIVRTVGDMARTLYGAGRDVIRGLVNGIGSMAGILADAVKGLAGNIVGGIKGALGISSPSKVFRTFGQNLGEGLALGMADSESGVVNAALRMSDAATIDPSGAIRPASSAGILAGDGDGEQRGGGLFIEHATFGDERVTRDLDLWARSKGAAV